MTSSFVVVLNPSTLLHRLRTRTLFFITKKDRAYFSFIRNARLGRAECDGFPTDETRNADWGTEGAGVWGEKQGKSFFSLKIPFLFVTFFCGLGWHNIRVQEEAWLG